MFPGTKLVLDGQEYVLPAISLGQLRNGVLDLLRNHDQLVAEGKTFEAIDLRGEVILTALRRNYPDFPEDTLRANLDLANIGDIWLKVLGMSGFTPGEDQAAEQAVTSGTSSPSIAA